MNALEIKNLTKTYPGFKLDNLNLVLPCGCIMGLVGVNGAGKSTTIKLILGMTAADSGSISILGKDSRENISLLKQDIGVVPDEIGLPGCMTAVQTGKVMRATFNNWDDSLYAETLRKLNLPLDKPFKDFSRGMKMKLGIAVALSHHPKLLILDAATSGLDPLVRDEVVDIFGEFTRDENHSVLISSHIVSDLEKICDYIAFLDNGKLILCDEKDALLERYGLIQCTKDELNSLQPSAIIGSKSSPYGEKALVLREALNRNMTVSPVSIEDLFIYMVKGEN